MSSNSYDPMVKTPTGYPGPDESYRLYDPKTNKLCTIEVDRTIKVSAAWKGVFKYELTENGGKPTAMSDDMLSKFNTFASYNDKMMGLKVKLFASAEQFRNEENLEELIIVQLIRENGRITFHHFKTGCTFSIPQSAFERALESKEDERTAPEDALESKEDEKTQESKEDERTTTDNAIESNEDETTENVQESKEDKRSTIKKALASKEAERATINRALESKEAERTKAENKDDHKSVKIRMPSALFQEARIFSQHERIYNSYARNLLSQAEKERLIER